MSRQAIPLCRMDGCRAFALPRPMLRPGPAGDAASSQQALVVGREQHNAKRPWPTFPAVTAAVANARRGAISHLTVAGERVAAIVPESVIEALRSTEDAEGIAEADAAWDEPG